MSEPFIGGTAAAALAGVNPPNWSQPIDVYMELTGQAPAKGTTRMMSMGHLMEPLVAQLFTEATDLQLRKPAARPDRTCSYLHPDGGCTATISREYPWAGAHLDRWASDGSSFEAKWAMGKDEWGPSWSILEPGDGFRAATLMPPDEGTRVPPRYAVQVQHGLAVTGRDRGYLAVLLGYGDFRWYVLERDAALIGQLLELEERFWRENVVPRVPPDPDGSAGYTRHLRRTLEQDDGAERVATPEQQAMAAQLKTLLAEKAAHDKFVEAARQKLMLSMGEAAKLIGPGFTINYRRSRPSLKVEWEALATELARRIYSGEAGGFLPESWPTTKKAQGELIRAVARSLELANEEPGARPFRVEFDSDEEATSAT